jgi:hypothetical protein
MIRNAARSEEEPVVRSRSRGCGDERCGRGSESKETPVGYTVVCPRCFFNPCSITTSSTSSSPGEQASHENPGAVCMGSWAQCTDAPERASDGRNAPYGMYGPLSRIFEFSTLAGPDHQSRSGRPSEETLRKVCMGSRTHWQCTCTDAREIVTWRKHHTQPWKCGGTTAVRPMEGRIVQ